MAFYSSQACASGAKEASSVDYYLYHISVREVSTGVGRSQVCGWLNLSHIADMAFCLFLTCISLLPCFQVFNVASPVVRSPQPPPPPSPLTPSTPQPCLHPPSPIPSPPCFLCPDAAPPPTIAAPLPLAPLSPPHPLSPCLHHSLFPVQMRAPLRHRRPPPLRPTCRRLPQGPPHHHQPSLVSLTPSGLLNHIACIV